MKKKDDIPTTCLNWCGQFMHRGHFILSSWPVKDSFLFSLKIQNTHVQFQNTKPLNTEIFL